MRRNTIADRAPLASNSARDVGRIVGSNTSRLIYGGGKLLPRKGV